MSFPVPIVGIVHFSLWEELYCKAWCAAFVCNFGSRVGSLHSTDLTCTSDTNQLILTHLLRLPNSTSNRDRCPWRQSPHPLPLPCFLSVSKRGVSTGPISGTGCEEQDLRASGRILDLVLQVLVVKGQPNHFISLCLSFLLCKMGIKVVYLPPNVVGIYWITICLFSWLLLGQF